MLVFQNDSGCSVFPCTNGAVIGVCISDGPRCETASILSHSPADANAAISTGKPGKRLSNTICN